MAWAAMVWPGAEMSSSSPSTVISAVRSIRAGRTVWPRTRMRFLGRSWVWKNVRTVCR